MSKSLDRCFFILIAVLFHAQGCKTPQFETTWQSDTRKWKEYALNGVQVRIPSELPMMKMNPTVWWFVIRAKQVDNFSGGVRQAIEISCVPQKELPADIAVTQAANSISKLGGKVSVVKQPVNGIQYFNPDVFEGKRRPGEGLSEANIVKGSSFGYIFSSPEGVIVQVNMFKISHPPVNYKQWNPKTEIFDQYERNLVDSIVASAR